MTKVHECQHDGGKTVVRTELGECPLCHAQRSFAKVQILLRQSEAARAGLAARVEDLESQLTEAEEQLERSERLATWLST